MSGRISAQMHFSTAFCPSAVLSGIPLEGCTVLWPKRERLYRALRDVWPIFATEKNDVLFLLKLLPFLLYKGIQRCSILSSGGNFPVFLNNYDNQFDR